MGLFDVIAAAAKRSVVANAAALQQPLAGAASSEPGCDDACVAAKAREAAADFLGGAAEAALQFLNFPRDVACYDLGITGKDGFGANCEVTLDTLCQTYGWCKDLHPALKLPAILEYKLFGLTLPIPAYLATDDNPLQREVTMVQDLVMAPFRFLRETAEHPPANARETGAWAANLSAMALLPFLLGKFVAPKAPGQTLPRPAELGLFERFNESAQTFGIVPPGTAEASAMGNWLKGLLPWTRYAKTMKMIDALAKGTVDQVTAEHVFRQEYAPEHIARMSELAGKGSLPMAKLLMLLEEEGHPLARGSSLDARLLARLSGDLAGGKDRIADLLCRAACDGDASAPRRFADFVAAVEGGHDALARLLFFDEAKAPGTSSLARALFERLPDEPGFLRWLASQIDAGRIDPKHFATNIDGPNSVLKSRIRSIAAEESKGTTPPARRLQIIEAKNVIDAANWKMKGSPNFIDRARTLQRLAEKGDGEGLSNFIDRDRRPVQPDRRTVAMPSEGPAGQPPASPPLFGKQPPRQPTEGPVSFNFGDGPTVAMPAEQPTEAMSLKDWAKAVAEQEAERQRNAQSTARRPEPADDLVSFDGDSVPGKK